jgi:hypothetical protein
VLNGTQVYVPVQTVVDVCGNAVAIGLSAAFAGCEGGADATIESASNEEALPALNNLPFVAGLPVIGSLGRSAPSVPDVDLGQDAARFRPPRVTAGTTMTTTTTGAAASVAAPRWSAPGTSGS